MKTEITETALSNESDGLRFHVKSRRPKVRD